MEVATIASLVEEFRRFLFAASVSFLSSMMTMLLFDLFHGRKDGWKNIPFRDDELSTVDEPSLSFFFLRYVATLEA
eukprot:14981750-Ditylum_brightwellii.AAC.1